jgi:hypothetical protein
MKLHDRIGATSWGSHAQPEWTKSSCVADALIKVSLANDAAAGSLACDQFLYAIGNNHAGTYYPVLLPTMPFLHEILNTGNPHAQTTVLCVLDDLVALFHAEPGHEAIEPIFLAEAQKFGPVLEKIAARGGYASAMAKQLLITLNEGAA